jgi:dipeptidyl aminopeptidase/acylaminoacyl peptidase
MRIRSKLVLLSLLLFAFLPSFAADTPAPAAHAQFKYQRPPDPIPAMVEAAPTPELVVSPTRDTVILVDWLRNPPISDLAAPMLRLAGLRINPATNGAHRVQHNVGLRVVNIASGKEAKVALPANALVSVPRFSPDGKKFSFTNTTANGIELWIGDVASATAHKVAGVVVSAIFASGLGGRDPVEWMPGSKSLLVTTVPSGRGAAPKANDVPDGPNVQESYGKPAPVATYEDLLKNPHDVALFDYYATTQLMMVDVAAGHAVAVGKPALFGTVSLSPDGNHILVARVHHPYSYLVTVGDFPRTVEVWDKTGKLEHTVAEVPSEEGVPLEGVITGPRSWAWRSTAPATLIWAEALDGGDPRKKADFRDRLMMQAAPFSAPAVELVKLEKRFVPRAAGLGGVGARSTGGYMWGNNGLLLVSDYDRDKRFLRTLMLNADKPGEAPQVLFARNIRERYKDAGTPVLRALPSGHLVLWQQGTNIFLRGDGASRNGDFPFLDRYDLDANKAERLFQAADQTFEEVNSLLSDDGTRFVTRFETPTDPPNYYIRAAGSNDRKALTHFGDPAPQLKGVTKKFVTYKRADGVDLNFTLYLPAGYKEGERLPTIVWAYPLEFSDADTAGQLSGSQYRFTIPTGYSHLFLLTQGYAVLDNTAMPVIGDARTMNDTYVDQVVADAKAAIDKAVEMGVTDRNRVGVGGHSYGAFMTANLLARSDLFRAGVARSGAYNRTLTPFGFQSERRTFWEAPEMYLNVSPFRYADKIKSPILLIHGEADDNSGTFPIQSERLYQAIKGNGGNVRYVTLPYEAHGYTARESVEHTLWEMVSWFNKYVKNAPAADATAAAAK